MIFPFFLGFLLFRFLVAQKRNTQGRSFKTLLFLSHSIVPFSNVHPTRAHAHTFTRHPTRAHRTQEQQRDEVHWNTRNTDHTNIHIVKRKGMNSPTSSADSIPSTEKMNDGCLIRVNPTGGWNDKETERITPKISPTTATLVFREKKPTKSALTYASAHFFRFSKFSPCLVGFEVFPVFWFFPELEISPFS